MEPEKARLREQLSAARRARPDDEIERARAAVRAAILRRRADAGWGCVAGYVPLRTEPGSIALLDGLRAGGVRVLVPILLPDRDLDWAEWDGTGAAPRPLGVGAIAGADAVLVPALAVSRDGVRLGRGGGSYDRALARVDAGTVRAALLFDGEVLERLPVEPWDVQVSDVVTPAGWRALRTNRDDADGPGGRVDAE